MSYADPEAQKKFQREWMAARRAKFLAKKKCKNCGAVEDLVLVGIHAPHNHTFWSYAYKKRRTKLKGIKVLCRPCIPLVKRKEEYKNLKKAAKGLNIKLTRLT